MWIAIVFSIVFVLGVVTAAGIGLYNLWKILPHSIKELKADIKHLKEPVSCPSHYYTRVDGLNGKQVGWYDTTTGLTVNTSKTAVIFPDKK